MIKEVKTQQLITSEVTPDNEILSIIDTYDGCTMGCPYCFQLNDEEWNKNIYVKTDVFERIRIEMKDWPKDKTIFIGSKCDPYMEIERKYMLTRKCLVELDNYSLPIMITTKSNLGLIERDIDLLKNYSGDVTILIGLSNIDMLNKRYQNEKFKNIEVANMLNQEGIKVRAFITPILPGITDVELMISKLDSNIPVFIDKLRIQKGTRSAQMMMKYIYDHCPQLYSQYEMILETGTCDYIEYINQIYKNSTRVHSTFNE